MSNRDKSIMKELSAIRALSMELTNRTSRLEEKLSPFKEGASRKGVSVADQAVARRNQRIKRS